MGYEFKRPDATAMERVLARHPADPEGAVLRLAWQAGLSREEIAGLTWPQVDLTDSVLYLSDRTVPLEGDTLNCLRRRHERYAAVSDHVVISDRYKRPMPPESVSRLARNALDAEDLRVSLKDLRQDFVIRQLETHELALRRRVSGMAVSTLRGAFSNISALRRKSARSRRAIYRSGNTSFGGFCSRRAAPLWGWPCG